VTSLHPRRNKAFSDSDKVSLDQIHSNMT